MELWKGYGRGLGSRCGGYVMDTAAGKVLRALALLRDRELSEKIKVRFSLRLLLRPLSALRAGLLSFEKQRELLYRILDSLGAGSREKSSSPALVSLYADSGLIYTALLQSYGVDLMKRDVDFRLLPLLIAGVSDTSALHRVLEIRAAEIPAVNGGNAEYVRQLQRLKAAYSLKEGDSFSDGMNRLFDSIKKFPPMERNEQKWTEK